jgi:hypothetical protein
MKFLNFQDVDLMMMMEYVMLFCNNFAARKEILDFNTFKIFI